MTTSALVPLSEYLQTAYEHDFEWVDGRLKERGVPDGYHGYFQQFFAVYFQAAGGLRALPETRMRVSARSYRIPDVLVLPMTAKFLPIPVDAPLICIEILSPDDRVSDLQEKIEDYLAMGVGAIWIVDPRRRRMSTADAAGMHVVQEFLVPGRDVRLGARELFSGLDEAELL